MSLPKNWRETLEIVSSKIQFESITFTLQFMKYKTPKGFSKKIGEITIGLNLEIPYVISSSIYESYFRNRRLGIMLYSHVLHEYGSLSTKYHSSSSHAQRLWLSLIKRYKHSTDFFNNLLIVQNITL